MTTVVVAEDELVTRSGIVHILRAGGLDVVAETQDLAGLLAAVEQLAPDAAVVDVRMPPTHTTEGLEGAALIRCTIRAPPSSCSRTWSIPSW
jgi:CheY-like chemotaxis protein